MKTNRLSAAFVALAALLLSLSGVSVAPTVHSASAASTITVTKVGVYNPRAPVSAAVTTAVNAAVTTHTRGVRLPYSVTQSRAAVRGTPPSAPDIKETQLQVVREFDGLSNGTNASLDGYNVEPPDMALCVGPGQIVQQVNILAAVYSTGGNQLAGPVTSNTFYSDVNSGSGGPTGGVQPYLSDPVCTYDPQAGAYVAEIWESDFVSESHIDLAVNPTSDALNPWTIYRIDTRFDSAGADCPCYPDFTKIGVDANGVYLASDNFSIASPAYDGASIIALSKNDLLAGAAQPNGVLYPDLMNAGQQAFALEPSVAPFGTGYTAGVEYFLNSLGSYTGAPDNRLALWALSNTALLNTGGQPTLSNAIVTVAPYAYPPNAAQKGSQNPLQTDSDFTLPPVQNVNGVLYNGLPTEVVPKGDNTPRVGAEWFEIQPAMSGDSLTGASVLAQGYVAHKNHDIFYPAIAVNRDGQPAMVVDYSGPNTYASIALAYGPTFGSLAVVVPGLKPYSGGSCDPNLGCRWGDYNAAAVAPGGDGLWFAAEYAGRPNKYGTANWNTAIFKVAP